MTAITHQDGSPDGPLVQRLLAGDEQAFVEVVRAHAGRSLALAKRFLKNEADAEEAVQEAFLSFFRSLDRFEANARLGTWLHRIVVNAALMKRRALGRSAERNIEDLLPTFYEDGYRIDPRAAWTMPSDVILQQRETRQMVRDKIDELPDKYRTILVLRDLEERDTAETATLLGESPGTVKTRLHRARQALRTLLERELV